MAGPSKTVTLEVRALTDEANAKLLGIRKNTQALVDANPIELKAKLEAAGARAELAVLRKEITSIPKETTARVKVKVDSSALDKLSKAGFLAPSAGGIAAALSPSLIPLAGSIAGAIGGIGISLASAGIAFGGFALLAKSALTQASTAAQAVEAAQNRYNASIATGTKRATAYKTEQRAILLAYAQMSPRQIALSKQVGQLQNAWQAVQKSITPLISGALVPWLHVVRDLLVVIKPFIAPIAHLFADWGQALARYFSNPIVLIHLKDIASAFGNFAAIQFAQITKFLVDVGKAFFNLGKDLQGATHLGDAGMWLANIGAGFLTWSKSESARDSVQGFMHFVHQEGPLVQSILKSLGKILPGLFIGATTAGVLELKAIAGFMSLIANLPKGWQAPLVEAAGALLLLSKTGVVSVGLKLTGKLAEHPTAFGFTIGTLLAAGIVAAVNRHAPGKQSIWQRFSPPPKGEQQTWLNSWAGLGDRIVQLADDARHGVSQAWDFMWKHTLASTKQGNHDISAAFDNFRHAVAAEWDRIWGESKAAVTTGIRDVVSFFRGLPGKAIGALFGFGHRLYAFGHAALGELWSGIKAGASGIFGWFSGFVSKILGFLGQLTGHSPSGEFYFAGQKMMTQLAAGIRSRAHHAANAAKAAAQRVSSGALGGDALANQALARRIFPWPASQWPAFVSLVMAESGFNRFARNPSSGAYGIPQALPPTKLPFAGQAAGGSHAGPQLSWMFQYIAQRYGTPAGAWAHELSAHWYDKGGWLPTGASIAINTTGRPERVGGSGEQRVVLEFAGGSGSDLEAILLAWIRKSVRIRGGNVQLVLGRA